MRRLLALALAAPLSWALPAAAQYGQQYRQPFGPQLREPPYGQYDDARQRPQWLEREQLAEAAHRLSDHALRLQRTVLQLEGYSPLADDAVRLAREAERFHQMVESPTPYPQLMAAFEQMQSEYYSLRSAFFQAHRSHHVEGVIDQWTRLVTSFERVALTLGVEEDQLCVVPHRSRNGRYDDPRFSDPRFSDPRFSDPRFSDPRLSQRDPRLIPPLLPGQRFGG